MWLWDEDYKTIPKKRTELVSSAMIQAVILMATVLGASVYYWNHNREMAMMNNKNSDIFLKRYDFHPILWNQCRWPNLDKEEEDIRKYLIKKKIPYCSLGFETDFSFGNLTVTYIENVTCAVSDLSGLTEKIELGVPNSMENYTEFVLECEKDGRILGRKTFFNLKNLRIPEETAKATSTHPSISVLYLKSMSRAHFLRNFPEFQKTLNIYSMHDFAMFNKISENVSETVFRTFNHDHSSIELFMRNRYCAVFTNDERRSGIRPDFSTRKFSDSIKSDSCVAGDSMRESLKWIEFWADYEMHNAENCHFSHIFIDNTIEHQDYRMDKLLSETFRRFAENRVLNNTILMVVSAEGIPIGEFGTSYTGKIEERTPIMMLNVPWRLQKSRRDHSYHLDKNQNSLITHRDVFETLESFTKASENQKIVVIDTVEWDRRNETDRGISVWQSLMPLLDLNCTTARIPEEFCLCMENQVEIEERYNRTNEMLERINEKMTFDIVNQEPYSCISNMNIDTRQNFTAVYNLNAKILANTDPYVQYLYVKNLAFDSANTARNTFFSAMGQFKQYIYEDDYRIETAYPYCLSNGAYFCYAGLLERFCEMCHDTLLLSY